MLLLIDGDVLCHISCPPLAKRVKHDENGQEIRIEDRGEEGITLIDEEKPSYSAMSEEELNWRRKVARNALLKKLEQWSDRFYAVDMLIAVKGPNNFRDIVFADYKMQRKNKPVKDVNPIVPELREMMLSRRLAIAADGREADDYLRIWAHEARMAGDPYIVISIDKDLDCIPGMHYNPNKDTVYHVNELDARRFEYQQVLSGDGTDFIPGVMGVGPKKAKQRVAEASSLEELQEIAVRSHACIYKEDWEQFLRINFKLIHLQEHEHDYVSISDWPAVKELKAFLMDWPTDVWFNWHDLAMEQSWVTKVARKEALLEKAGFNALHRLNKGASAPVAKLDHLVQPLSSEEAKIIATPPVFAVNPPAESAPAVPKLRPPSSKPATGLLATKLPQSKPFKGLVVGKPFTGKVPSKKRD